MQKSEDSAVEELLQTYGETGGINYLDAAATLPSRLSIENSCTDLMSLMFPGFRSEPLVSSEDLAEITRVRVRTLRARLKTEICRSLGKIPPKEAIAIQRMAHVLYEMNLPLIPRIMTEWAHSRTGIDIHPGAKIGSHFFIDHGTGVVVGETSEIGARVKLYHGVTLGARSFQKDEHGKIKKGGKRHPKVEDDVTIYPNSTVLGGETVIGARSTIGGNVFLVQSVPPDSLVYYEEKQLRIVPKRPCQTGDRGEGFTG